MTQNERDELKRFAHNADKLITLNLEGNIPWNQGVMDAFNVSASPKAVLDLLAENQRVRELLIRAAKVLGGLGPGNLLAAIEHFLKTECEVPEVFIRLNDRSAEK